MKKLFCLLVTLMVDVAKINAAATIPWSLTNSGANATPLTLGAGMINSNFLYLLNIATNPVAGTIFSNVTIINSVSSNLSVTNITINGGTNINVVNSNNTFYGGNTYGGNTYNTTVSNVTIINPIYGAPVVPRLTVTNRLKQWFIADNIPATNNQTLTATIRDVSGYNNHALPVGGVTYQTGVANGHSVIDFGTLAGSDGYLNVSNFHTGFTYGELIAVVQFEKSPGGRLITSGFISFGRLTNTYPSFTLPADGKIYEAFGTSTNKGGIKPIESINSFFAYNVASEAGSYAIRMNSTNIYVDSFNAVAWNTNAYIGRSDDQTLAGTYYGRFKLAEWLLYDLTLTPSERQAIWEGYLAPKYNLPLNQAVNNTEQANIIADWDSRGLTNTVNGSSVANWFDSSGYNRTASQSTGSQQPTYLTNYFGSYPGVSFDGSNDELNFTPDDVSQFTVYIVGNITGEGGAFSGPFGFAATGKAGFIVPSESGSTANYQDHLTIFSSGSETFNFKAPDRSLNLSQYSDGNRIRVWSYDGTTARMNFNGVNKTVTGGGGGYSRDASIGKAYAYSKIVVGKILVYSVAHTEEQKARVIAYLQKLYPAAASTYSPVSSLSNGGLGTDASTFTQGSILWKDTNSINAVQNLRYVPGGVFASLMMESYTGSPSILWTNSAASANKRKWRMAGNSDGSWQLYYESDSGSLTPTIYAQADSSGPTNVAIYPRLSLGTVIVLSGSGSPENAVVALVGSLYLRTDGGANTTLYIKESGTGNTGWVAK